MNVVRIHRRLRSPIAELPELDGMIGKEIEILVSERPVEADADDRIARRMAALDVLVAMAQSGEYDLDAVDDLRRASMTIELRSNSQDDPH